MPFVKPLWSLVKTDLALGTKGTSQHLGGTAAQSCRPMAALGSVPPDDMENELEIRLVDCCTLCCRALEKLGGGI